MSKSQQEQVFSEIQFIINQQTYYTNQYYLSQYSTGNKLMLGNAMCSYLILYTYWIKIIIY